MIEPIQKKVFAAIEAYAKQAGADVVLDSANNPHTALYESQCGAHAAVDRHTEEVETSNN